MKYFNIKLYQVYNIFVPFKDSTIYKNVAEILLKLALNTNLSMYLALSGNQIHKSSGEKE